MKAYTKKIWLSSMLIGMVIGVSLTFLRTQVQKEKISTTEPVSVAGISAKTHAAYIQLSRQEMIKQADAIVVGQVTSISATQFNQDSGEIWEPQAEGAMPLALHYIDVRVGSLLVDAVGLNKTVTIVVLGTSPIESAAWADHHLQEGDQVVVFLQAADITWRTGTRSIWRFVALPSESALVLQSDGAYHDGWLDKVPLSLDELRLQIAQS